jgi:hypothetical protein
MKKCLTIRIYASEGREGGNTPSTDCAGGLGRSWPLVILDFEDAIAKSDVGGGHRSTPHRRSASSRVEFVLSRHAHL